MTTPPSSTRPAPPQDPWATLTLDLQDPPAAATAIPSPEELGERIDTLATWLAEEPGISGVEIRDPSTLGARSDRPALIVYTTPAAVASLGPRAASLAASLGLEFTAEIAIRDDDDWRDSWKQFYAPIVCGDGALLLRPSWIPRREDDPPLEIILDPGRAFGTGQHESTRLCLELLCALANAPAAAAEPPRSLLDLGCGSGILALAAARLFPGLSRRVAADLDPEATATTAENAALNQVVLETITGEISEISGRFDLLCANIRTEVLIPEAAAITDHLTATGDLLLSGILIEEGAAVVAAYSARGLTLAGRRTAGEWVALHLRRSPGA